MKDIIPTYSCVVAKEIDNNFYKNEIYIMYKSTYESRKKSIDEAEAIIVGPHVNEQKYINPKYIGKIKSKGNYSIKYNSETKVFEAIYIEGKKKGENIPFLERLLSTHKRQQKFFNINLEHLDEGITDRYFIEIQKMNSYDNANVFFKEKTLFYLNEYFDGDGILIDKAHDFRYFKLNTDKNLFYDIKREIFFGEGIEEIGFDSTNRSLLNSWMRLLIKEKDVFLTNSDIGKYLFPNSNKHTEDVNELKKELKRFFLKINIDDIAFSDKILYSPSYNQYKILGKMLSNKEFLELTK